MTTLHDHMKAMGVRKSQGPQSNIRADYDLSQFNMNNYIMEVAPADAELGDDFIKKDLDAPMTKFNFDLLTRQKKPEVVEQPTLGSNVNDNLEYLVTGSEEKYK